MCSYVKTYLIGCIPDKSNIEMRISHQGFRLLEYICKGGLKRSYDDDVSAIDGFFDQRDLSTAIPMEEASGLQGRPC